jgi:predicted ATP-grasp superfamily ATP-dependent carboligase
MSDTITILGASVRAAAQSAVKAGLRVVAGDHFADVDTSEVAGCIEVQNYPAGLVDVCKEAQPGPWMYTGALENHLDVLAECARIRPLWGCHADTVAAVRDPFEWTRAIAAAGVHVPRVLSNAPVRSEAVSWLQKPLRSAAGHGVRVWRREGNDLSSGCYLQEYIPGIPMGASFVAAGGKATLLGICEQLIGRGELGGSGFRYCGSVGPLRLPRAILQQAELIGNVLAQAFELRGLFGVDMILHRRQFWPIEINPRYTASMELIERATGKSLVALHIAACKQNRLETKDQCLWPAPPNATILAKGILFDERPLRVAGDLCAMNQVSPSGGNLIADIPAVGSEIRPGSPILTLFAAGESRTAARKALLHRANWLRHAAPLSESVVP